LAEYDKYVKEAQEAVSKEIERHGTNMTKYAKSIGVNPGIMSILMSRGKLRPVLAQRLHQEGLIKLPPKPVEMTQATAAVILVAMEPKKIKKKPATKKRRRSPRFAAVKDDPEKAAASVLRNMGDELALQVAKLIIEEIQLERE
jgi:hypothetical protein